LIDSQPTIDEGVSINFDGRPANTGRGFNQA